jgi:hypothetical protein
MTTLHPSPPSWRDAREHDRWRCATRVATQPDAVRALQELRVAFQTREQPPASAATMTSLPFVAALVIVVGTLAALPEIIAIDRNWWHSRFLAPLTFAGLIVWLLASRRPPARVTIFAAATTAASFVLLTLLPERATDSTNVLARMSDTVRLAVAHVPLVLLGVAGVAFCTGSRGTVSARIDFLRFALALPMIASVLVVGVAGVGVLALFVYGAVGIDLSEWYLRWVLLPGAVAAPVLAAWISGRLAGRAEELTRTLARFFAPPLLVVAATFPAVLFAEGGDALQQREILRQLHGLLAVVFAAAICAIATRRSDEQPGAADAITAGLLLTALAIDLIALAGLLPRIAAWGLTPNRAVAAGADLLVLGHVMVLLWTLARQARSGGASMGMQAALVRWLPVYAAWAALVALGVPAVFGVR